MRKFLQILLLTLFLLAQASAEPSKDVVELVELRPNVYLHRSYMQTDDFGLVDCNGLVYVVNGEALVIDTPPTDALSEQLIAKLRHELDAGVVGVVIGHTHADSMGGLGAFLKANISTYGSNETRRLARKLKLPVPYIGYDSDFDINVGDRKVRTAYFGPGHTKDNAVTYLVDEKVLFGGCLIKAEGAGRGYLGDADVARWSETVGRVKAAFPDVEVVIPGHGAEGGTELLDYTIEMFASDSGQ